MTPDTELTDHEMARMSDADLEAWSDALATGPWEPNASEATTGRPPMVSITVRMPRDLLAELRIEAARHGQPYQRYMKDLLLLALRQVQGGERRPRRAAQLRLTDEQLDELTTHGELTLRLRRQRPRPDEVA